MPRTPASLPDELGESFSVRSARAAGVTAGRLRHSDLDVPFRGVRVHARDADGDKGTRDESPYAAEARRLTAETRRRAHAFAQIAPSDWFFSRVTAAVLWGLPVPLRLLRRAVAPVRRQGAVDQPHGIDVAVMAPRRAPRAAGSHGHRCSPTQVSIRTTDDLRVSSPVSTWAMLADVLSVDELVELGDAIVHIPRRRGMERGTEADALGTVDQLVAAANTPYRRHAARLRAAIALVRVGSSSAAETRTRRAWERAGLPRPELDFDVFALDGTAIGFTEFAFPEFHLLVEYEGDHHRTDRDQWQRDIEKHAACVEAGWEVLRLTARHVYPSTAPAVDKVRKALIRAGWRP